MKCPHCFAWTEVRETRTDGPKVTRRRECANGHRVKTVETFVPMTALGKAISEGHARKRGKGESSCGKL